MGRGIGRLRAVVRQGWASSARQFSSQNSLPQEQEAEPFEVLGLDDITSLITTKCRILVNPISGYGYEEQDADTDPIKIFQSCWGWSSSDECSAWQKALCPMTLQPPLCRKAGVLIHSRSLVQKSQS
ncbi:hypothetical protein GOP47_0029141 [Adiantum capillus-veneris]|nr:hypothetical protein GOP47_0029141 [Adiantum capillus-veneris]